MEFRRSALSSPPPLWIGLALFLLWLPACDDVDPADVVRAAVEVRANLDPSMESIGPEGAKRVYYQFIDDRGQVQFVERLSDVPAAWREQVGYVEMAQPPPLSPEEARKTWRVSSDRAAEIMLARATPTASAPAIGSGRDDVILYYADWCGYCKKARAHLEDAGIQYDLRDVDNDAVGRELRQKTGRGGIPVLDFSGEILRGYSAEQYDRAIRTIRG